MHESLIAAIICIIAAVLFYTAVRSLRQKKAQSSPAQASYFSGLSYYVAGDKGKALEKFLATVRQDTEYIDAYIKIGDILREMGEGEKAVKIHRDLLVRQNLLDEQILSIYHALAQDYRVTKKFKQAIETIDKIFLLQKNNPWAIEFQLKLHEEMEDWQRAVEIVTLNERLSKEEKKKQIAYYRLEQGMALARQKKEHEARLRFREAIKENDHFLPAYLELVDSYMRDLRPKASLTILKKIAKLKWTFPELVFNRLKQVLFELGLFNDMTQFYAELEQEYPDSAETQLGLAEIYMKKGELSKALDACKTALSNETDRLDAKLLLAALYLKKGSPDKTSEVLAQAISQISNKQKTYLCGACGHRLEYYFYRCPNCKAWDTALKG